MHQKGGTSALTSASSWLVVLTMCCTQHPPSLPCLDAIDAMKEAQAYDAAAAAAPPPPPADPESAEGAEDAEAPPAPAVPPLVPLGREAAEKLRTGQDVPDELVVAVLVIAMQVRLAESHALCLSLGMLVQGCRLALVLRSNTHPH